MTVFRVLVVIPVVSPSSELRPGAGVDVVLVVVVTTALDPLLRIWVITSTFVEMTGVAEIKEEASLAVGVHLKEKLVLCGTDDAVVSPAMGVGLSPPPPPPVVGIDTGGVLEGLATAGVLVEVVGTTTTSGAGGFVVVVVVGTGAGGWLVGVVWLSAFAEVVGVTLKNAPNAVVKSSIGCPITCPFTVIKSAWATENAAEAIRSFWKALFECILLQATNVLYSVAACFSSHALKSTWFLSRNRLVIRSIWACKSLQSSTRR